MDKTDLAMSELEPNPFAGEDGQIRLIHATGYSSEAYRSLLADSLSVLGITLTEGVFPDIPRTPEVSPILLACTARALLGAAPAIELNPKRGNARARSFGARFSARRTRWALGSAGAAILLIAAAFGLQAWRLARLEHEWSDIGPRVAEAQSLQDLVRKYRSWYDDTIPSLAIPMGLALAFPDEGSVWIKSLRVKERTVATCTGSAASRADWMQVMEKLGKNKDVDDLQVVQARGDAPFTFTVTFRWKGDKGLQPLVQAEGREASGS